MIPWHAVSLDAVDEWWDWHVERREHHDVVEQVLEQEDDSVGLVDGVDVVVESIVATRQTSLDDLSVEDVVPVLNLQAFWINVGSQVAKVFRKCKHKLKLKYKKC